MKRALFVMIFAASPLAAQEQQAGNQASQDSDATFQALIDACDDVDALMLRARIRTTDAAGSKAQEMLDQGFATCGGGDLEGAKMILTEALEIAEAGAEENFAVEEAAAAEAQAAEDAAAEAAESENRGSSSGKTVGVGAGALLTKAWRAA